MQKKIITIYALYLPSIAAFIILFGSWCDQPLSKCVVSTTELLDSFFRFFILCTIYILCIHEQNNWFGCHSNLQEAAPIALILCCALAYVLCEHAVGEQYDFYRSYRSNQLSMHFFYAVRSSDSYSCTSSSRLVTLCKRSILITDLISPELTFYARAALLATIIRYMHTTPRI